MNKYTAPSNIELEYAHLYVFVGGIFFKKRLKIVEF